MGNWFAFNGLGDPLLPGSYNKVEVTPNCVVGGCTVCAIYLDDNNDVPAVIPGSIKRYIVNAQVALVSQPSNAIRFVYVKDCG